MFNSDKLKLKCLLMFFSIGFMPSIYAVENGAIITPPGIFDFSAGVLPPVSSNGAFEFKTSYQYGSKLVDNGGKAQDISLNVLTTAITYVRMTEIPVLGGTYGFAVAVPFHDMDLRVSVPGGNNEITLMGKDQNLGDIQFFPLIVRWKNGPQLYTQAHFAIQAPTGHYDREALISTGSNHWTFSPGYGVTFISASGYELSSKIQLNLNTENKDTQYKSGLEYQHDFALGKHYKNITFGLGGYFYKQLTDDKAHYINNGHRSEVVALGPAIHYFFPNSSVPFINVHYYKEFNAKNRAEGSQIVLKTSWVF